MEISLTHIGGPTVLIEVGGWRLLTDPTFDPPGQSYRFGRSHERGGFYCLGLQQGQRSLLRKGR